MKKLRIFLIPFIFLFACAGSEVYRGKWKALDEQGHKFEIIFTEKDLSIQDSTGKSSKYGYTQHHYESSNGIVTYGIQLEDGRQYQIHFPKEDNEDIAVMKDDNGKPVYTIGRKQFVAYDEIYALN